MKPLDFISKYIITCFLLLKLAESAQVNLEEVNYHLGEDCLLDEGRVCVNSSSVLLSRGMNPGGFLVMECLIDQTGEGLNLDPIIQIQASTPSNYTTLLYNINHDSVEIFDLSWSMSKSSEKLPDNLVFSKNDTVHFAVGIDTNSASTIVLNSKNVLRLQFKGTEHLTKFKSKKSRLCTWRYEMTLTFPQTKTNTKYATETPDEADKGEDLIQLPNSQTSNDTEHVQINSTGTVSN